MVDCTALVMQLRKDTLVRIRQEALILNVNVMEDIYRNLSDEELRSIWEDLESDYWIDYYKSFDMEDVL